MNRARNVLGGLAIIGLLVGVKFCADFVIWLCLGGHTTP